jgi:hypothetical protein
MLETEAKTLVAALGASWHRSGAVCRCPAHDDRSPSLSVRVGNRRLLFHCFAGCSTGSVLRALRARGLINARTPFPSCNSSDHVWACAANHNLGAAVRLWKDAHPLEGTLAARYLMQRALSAGSAELRYHPRTACGPLAGAVFLPAMLAAVRDDNGIVAVHRTFLDPISARLGSIADPKRALGHLGGGAVRLAPSGRTLGLAEGIENALAATLLTGIPCWATLGTERFARVRLPSGLKRLVLFLDHDGGGMRADRLARTVADPQLIVESRIPRLVGTDWNDVLLGAGPSRTNPPPD